MAVGTIPLLLFTTVRADIEGPVQISDKENVEQPIMVVIHEGGACGPASARGPRGARNVFERSITLVAVENVLRIAGHIKILIAVVVIIGYGHAHSVPASLETCLAGYVLKTTPLRLSIKTVVELSAGLLRDKAFGGGRRDGCTVNQIDVEHAVAISVE